MLLQALAGWPQRTLAGCSGLSVRHAIPICPLRRPRAAKPEIRLTPGKGLDDLTCGVEELIDQVVKTCKVGALHWAGRAASLGWVGGGWSLSANDELLRGTANGLHWAGWPLRSDARHDKTLHWSGRWAPSANGELPWHAHGASACNRLVHLSCLPHACRWWRL